MELVFDSLYKLIDAEDHTALAIVRVMETENRFESLTPEELEYAQENGLYPDEYEEDMIEGELQLYVEKSLHEHFSEGTVFDIFAEECLEGTYIFEELKGHVYLSESQLMELANLSIDNGDEEWFKEITERLHALKQEERI